MRNICLVVMIGVLLPVHMISAQEGRNYSRAEIDSLVNPPLLKDGEHILHFASDKYDIGAISEDDAPYTCKFVFRNISQSPVTISRVTTSCGCTVAKFDRQPVQPGKESVILLTYNPRNFPGTIDTRAFVYTEVSEQMPVARLSLVGNVTPSGDEWNRFPCSMGALRLKHNQVNFSDINPSKKPSGRILCGNSGKKPLKLSAFMIPSYASFRTEPEVIMPGEEADIVITLDGSKLPTDIGKELKFSLIIEGIDIRPRERSIKVTVRRTQY